MVANRVFLLKGLPVPFRMLLAFAGFLFTDVSVRAQIVQQPAHPLKVYVSPKDGIVFWPQNLPFYVRLSTGPDASSPSFLLQEGAVRAGSDARKSQAETGNPPQGRLDLEMSGNQFMRWVNHATKDTFLLRFVSDGIPPKTAVTFSGAPTFVGNEGTVYYGKGLSASLKSLDEHSGVEKTFLSIDGATFSNYVTTLQFSLEKKNQLSFYALDNTGNAEPLQTNLFTVDLTPPISRHSLGGLFQATILSTTAAISLSATDNLSGVNRIEYRFDNQDFRIYPDKVIGMNELEDGEHALIYHSVDEVTNMEDDHTFKFYLDRLPPVPDLSWDTDFFTGSSAVYVSTRTKFYLNATDNKSGVKNIIYTIDGTGEQTYTKFFQLTEKTGPRIIRFSTTDQMDNTAKPVEKLLIMDVTPPVSTFEFEGISYSSRNIHWITSKTGILLKSNDAQSGVAYIGFTTAPKATEQKFDKAFTMINEAPFTLTYGATDNVMNKEKMKTVRIVVDNTPPAISVNFGSGKIGSTSDSKNASVVDIYPIGTQVYLAATDASSGLKQISYNFSGQAPAPYTIPLIMNQTGEFELTVIAVDYVGNKQNLVLRYLISDQQ